MRRGIAFRLGTMQSLHYHCLRLSSFADPDALVPCVPKICVPSTHTLSEPRTATAATAMFSGFLDDAALGTYGVDQGCSHCCCCWHMQNDQMHEEEKVAKSLSSI